MTAKEAIDILWQYDVNFEPHPAEEVMHAIDMAIEALKFVTINADSNAIKVTNCNDNDLISRQDAIKFFVELWDCIGTIGDREEWEDVCVTTVNEIKSAQPEHLVKESDGLVNDLVKDTISRKSVIVGLDYIINELNKLITDNSPNGVYMDIKDQVEEIKRGVLNIPSAQLDIEEKLDDAYAHGYSDAESKYRALMDKDGDAISRQAAIDEAKELYDMGGCYCDRASMIGMLNSLPSAQPEPLTDKEQRIFLAAMGREEKVCEEVDRNHVREPYEDSLMSVCREIKRKVKGVLWT